MELIKAAFNASRAGETDTLRYLLNSGLDPNDRCPGTGIILPLDAIQSIEQGNPSLAVVLLLLESGAD